MDKNIEQGIDYLQKAAKNESIDANVLLGKLYLYHTDLPHDYVKAFSYFKEASEQGSSEAMQMIGNMYYRGLGVEKNINTAIEWFQKAISKDDATAYFRMGDLYYRGEGVAQNMDMALHDYQKSSALGNSFGTYRVGFLYFSDLIPEHTPADALEWFYEAANNNEACAYHDLGVMYATGKGVDKNKRLAIYYYTRAIEIGYEKEKFITYVAIPEEQYGVYANYLYFLYTKNQEKLSSIQAKYAKSDEFTRLENTFRDACWRRSYQPLE